MQFPFGHYCAHQCAGLVLLVVFYGDAPHCGLQKVLFSNFATPEHVVQPGNCVACTTINNKSPYNTTSCVQTIVRKFIHRYQGSFL